MEQRSWIWIDIHVYVLTTGILSSKEALSFNNKIDMGCIEIKVCAFQTASYNIWEVKSLKNDQI